jgi:hypothetical protein
MTHRQDQPPSLRCDQVAPGDVFVRNHLYNIRLHRYKTPFRKHSVCRQAYVPDALAVAKLSLINGYVVPILCDMVGYNVSLKIVSFNIVRGNTPAIRLIITGNPPGKNAD